MRKIIAALAIIGLTQGALGQGAPPPTLNATTIPRLPSATLPLGAGDLLIVNQVTKTAPLLYQTRKVPYGSIVTQPQQGGTGLSSLVPLGLPLLSNGNSPMLLGGKQGTSNTFAATVGAFNNGDCRSTDATGNEVSAGGPCTIGGGGGTVAAGSKGYIGAYNATGTTIVGIPAVCTPFETYGGSTANAGSANTTAIVALLTSFAGGSGCVQFGPGIYAFSARINYTLGSGVNAIQFRGSGRDVSILNFPSTDGFLITESDCNNNSFGFSDMTVATGGAAASTGITAGCTASTANTLLPPISTFTNINLGTVGGHPLSGIWNAWGTGIQLRGMNNVNFTNVDYWGYGTTLGSSQGLGVGVSGVPFGTSIGSCTPTICTGTVFNFVGCNFWYGGNGIEYQDYAQGISVASSNFVGGQVGIDSHPSTFGILDQLTVTGSQFNNYTAGIELLTEIPDTIIANNLFIMALQNGSAAFVGIAFYGSFTGNHFWSNGTNNSAVQLLAGTIGAMLTGNIFSGNGNAQNFGIVTANTTLSANVQSNVYFNVTHPTSPATTTGNVRIGGGSP